jgi:hypothetical protein
LIRFASHLDGAGGITLLFRKFVSLLERDIAEKFFGDVLAQARNANSLSDEHFGVDGTLI